MAITFLPPDVEQGSCSVTVGIVAGTLDIDRVPFQRAGFASVL